MEAKKGVLVLGDLEKSGRFLTEVYPKILTDWKVFASKSFDSKSQIISNLSLEVRTRKENINWVEVDLNFSAGEEATAHWSQILKAVRQQKQYVT